MKSFTAVQMAHFLLKEKLQTASCAIDATGGNGHDTLFLARYSGDDTKIYMFDIQQTAIDKTRKRLAASALEHKVRLIGDSHAHMHMHCREKPDIIMFNLGYLPGDQHTITTVTETTLTAVRTGLEMLASGGLMTIAVYPGHPEGQKELEALRIFLAGVCQASYTVACWNMINQINRPPVLFIIGKV